MPTLMIRVKEQTQEHLTTGAIERKYNPMTQGQIEWQVQEFIQQNFIFNDTRVVGKEESLIGTGIIDSTGVLELISYLENTFNLHFEDNELVAENFDSVTRISSFVLSKM